MNKLRQLADILTASISGKYLRRKVDDSGYEWVDAGSIINQLTDIGDIPDPMQGSFLKRTENGYAWELPGAGTTNRVAETITNLKSTFEVAYDLGMLMIWLNGIYLTPSDYSATDGSTVVFTPGILGTPENPQYILILAGLTVDNSYPRVFEQEEEPLATRSGDTWIKPSTGAIKKWSKVSNGWLLVNTLPTIISGTSAPPDPTGLPEGTVYFKY